MTTTPKSHQISHTLRDQQGSRAVQPQAQQPLDRVAQSVEQRTFNAPRTRRSVVPRSASSEQIGLVLNAFVRYVAHNLAHTGKLRVWS